MDPIYLSNLPAEYNATSLIDLSLLDKNWQILLVIMYTSTAIVSLVSNILAIIVLLKNDRISSELWKYLVNLSISDIGMALFCIPSTYTSFMLGRWIFPNWFCPISQFAQICSVFVSVYTLTVIGFDRYFAIVYPFHALIHLKRNKSQTLIIIWVLAIVFSSVQLIKTRAVSYKYGNETYYDCKELWDDHEGQIFTIVVFVTVFALPITALVFVYTSIGLHILRRSTPGNPDTVRDCGQWALKVKVIKMLVTIVIFFVLCWLPIHIHGFVVWFYPPNVDIWSGYMTYVLSYFICHWLAMAHSCLNPFIYGFMSENFKDSFRKVFCTRKRRLRFDQSVTISKSDADLDKASNLMCTKQESVL